MTRRTLEWSPQHLEALEDLLRAANGPRRSRTLSLDDVRANVERALDADVPFSFAHGGDAPDARALTTATLAVVTERGVTVGVASAHAEGITPARAWSDLTSWDRFQPRANTAQALAWGGRAKPDRVQVSFGAPPEQRTLTREALLTDVLARPDDDAPRLVLADWLTDRGDPRGEFITTQIELARATAPARREELEARAHELLLLHGAAWLGPAVDPTRVRFERGFVVEAKVLEAPGLRARFFEEEPVRSLRLELAGPIDWLEFASLGWLARLEALSFELPGRLGPTELEQVLTSRSLRSLQALSFDSQPFADLGLRALASSGAGVLPAVQRLSISRAPITSAGVEALVAGRWGNALTELSLAHTELRAEGAEALAAPRSVSKLVALDLSASKLGSEGAAALARSRRFPALRRLRLGGNNIGKPGLEALLTSSGLARLEALDLAQNPIGRAGRERLRARFGV